MEKRLGRSVAILAIIGVASLCLFRSVLAQTSQQQQGIRPAMGMDQLHTVVNHGLQMFMGANLVMLAQLKMSPGLDQEALDHGRSMMEQGKKSIQQILNGPQVQGGTNGEQEDDSVIEYAQDLAELLVKVGDQLEQVKLEEMNPDTKTMHYFNLLINQALEMALEGSNLIMGRQAEKRSEMDRGSVEHGRKMLSDARSIIIEIMGSKAMGEMHSRESGKMPAMGFTHNLTSAALEVMDLLDILPQGR